MFLVTALEQGRFRGPIAWACAAAWAGFTRRHVAHRIDFPSRARVVAVGGATLGGSGKTPLSIACAAELAASGARVALVGHAYRASPGRARVVASDDSLGEVGDEALLACRLLAPSGVRVWVAPKRSDAIALAAREADVVVLDGVAQTAPVRASLALLAVDAFEPWGRACAVPPRGDLRAPAKALLDACDGIVAIDDAPGRIADIALGATTTVEVWQAAVVSAGVQVGDTVRTWEDLAGVRIGLLCALARPERVVRSLERRGLAVSAIVRCRDHGPWTRGLVARAVRARREQGIEVWLATHKCAIHLSDLVANVGNLLHAPVGSIHHSLVLSSALRQRLRAVVAP